MFSWVKKEIFLEASSYRHMRLKGISDTSSSSSIERLWLETTIQKNYKQHSDDNVVSSHRELNIKKIKRFSMSYDDTTI